MRNPCREIKGWWEREGERAKAKGGWQFFWYSLTVGLLWGLFMVVWLTTFDYLDGTYRPGSMQSRASMFFVFGMLFGLFVWIKGAASGKSRRP